MKTHARVFEAEHGSTHHKSNYRQTELFIEMVVAS